MDLSHNQDETILFSITENGDKNRPPRWGLSCTIDIVGKCEEMEFDRREVTFVYGDYKSAGIPEAMLRVIGALSESGCGHVKFRKDQAFDDSERAAHGLRKGADVEYELCVKSCEQVCL